jgi:sensor domain CHASE-containing protein
MNLSEISTTQIALVIAVVVLVAAGIVIWLSMRKRRTEKLRTQFGGA